MSTRTSAGSGQNLTENHALRAASLQVTLSCQPQFLTFCPESDTLWNVWTDGDPKIIGRVFLENGRATFIAGESRVPSAEHTIDCEYEYPFNAGELVEIAAFLAKTSAKGGAA